MYGRTSSYYISQCCLSEVTSASPKPHPQLSVIPSVRISSAVFTCIGALGTPSRTGPLARRYLPGFPYSGFLRRLRQKISSIYCTAICNYPSAAQEHPMYNSVQVDQICTASVTAFVRSCSSINNEKFKKKYFTTASRGPSKRKKIRGPGHVPSVPIG